MSQVINIQVTLDAEGIIKKYPNPSQDKDKPTG